MEEAEAAGKPAEEAVVDEDAMMQDAPGVAPLAEAGLSAEVTRMMPMDAIEALLGVQSDGTIHGYRQPSLAEITWQIFRRHASCASCQTAGRSSNG